MTTIQLPSRIALVSAGFSLGLALLTGCASSPAASSNGNGGSNAASGNVGPDISFTSSAWNEPVFYELAVR